MAAEPNTHLRLVPDAAGIDVAGHVPPHDLDAEAAVISALFIDDSLVRLVEPIIRPDHFYSEGHRRIFEAILAVSRENVKDEKACIVRVASWLNARGRIAQVGGTAYLTEILNVCPALANLEKYAAIVHETWRVRQAIMRCQEFAARGYLDHADTQGYLDGAAQSLLDLARQSIRPIEETNAETLKRIIDRLSTKAPADQPDVAGGLRIGVPAFDQLTHGVRPGQKITLAADTGVGKTAFAIQAALNIARQGMGALFFETELTRDEMFERFVCQTARVPSDRFKTKELTSDEWRRITAAHVSLHKLPFRLVEASEFTVEDIRARTLVEVERMRIDYGVPLGFVVIDYVQRLEVSRGTERLPKHEQIGHMTKRIKKLAQELSIPVLELAQRKNVDDDSKGKKQGKPKKGQVAESYHIEKEADCVVFLWEPFPGPEGDPQRTVSMVMTKQRGGGRGERTIAFQADEYRFDVVDDGARGPQPVRDYVDQGGWTNHEFAQGAYPEEDER